MENKPLNIILSKVSIVRDNRDDYDFYNIHELVDLNLSENNYDKCRFFNVGDKITLENKQYEITKISFRLNPVGQTLDEHQNINSNEPSWNNSALLVFVTGI